MKAIAAKKRSPCEIILQQIENILWQNDMKIEVSDKTGGLNLIIGNDSLKLQNTKLNLPLYSLPRNNKHDRLLLNKYFV